MSKFKLSSTSNSRLNTCHEKLQEVIREAIKRTNVDFGVSEGYRSIQRQQELYASGRTKPGPILTYVDGIKKKSKHNVYPSQAVDIYAWVNKASWDSRYLIYLGGVITSTANDLGIDIRWGGNWDSDGEIITDQSFLDLPHFEIIL